LKWVLTKFHLFVTSGTSAFTRGRIVAPENMQDVAALEAGSLISFPFLIDQQREGDAGLLAEQTGVVPVAKSDGRNAGAGSLELVLVFAQLRDMLAAEDSTVMTKKRHHRRPFLPQRAQSNVVSIHVRKDDTGKRRTQ
jgi:hypothetical protein